MIALPAQLFFTVQIPACLWFIRKKRDKKETLFIDARNIGFMADRTHRDFSDEDILKITKAYHDWRKGSPDYQDVKGFCKSASLEEIAANDYTLTPGRYVGIKETETSKEEFDAKMAALVADLNAQMTKGAELDAQIKANLTALGWNV